KVAARLRATDERPDLVVFYDGFNDVVGTVVDSTLRGVQPDKPAMLVASDLQRVEDELLDPHRAGPPEELGRLAARKYRREREAIDRAPEFEGIPTLHVWQPDALASERQFAAVRPIYEHLQPRHRYLDVAIDAALAELGDEVLDLRRVLDE